MAPVHLAFRIEQMTPRPKVIIAGVLMILIGLALFAVVGATNHPSKPQCWIELKPDHTWEPLCKAGAYDIDTNYSKWPVVVVK
jgi:hypothetical protein